MTEEAEKRMQERMEALAAQVESLRSELRAVREQAANRDSVDFGGGGEPDWSGAMGTVPDGFIENPAIPPLPDTTAAKNPNRLQYKSIDDRAQDCAPPGVTQIHDFDEAPLSNTRRIQILTVPGTGTNPTKLKLVDPDGNADFRTKWMIPLREAGTGGREIKWACIGGEVGLPEGGEGCAPEVTLTPLPGTTAHPNGGVRITVTPCEGTATSQDVWNGDDGPQGPQGPAGADGADGADGCTPTVTAGTTPSEHGDLACTITPCGEGATPISVYHGKNGADGATGATGPQGPQGPAGADGADGSDGCTPTVTAGTTPSEHGDLACTITPCGEGATPISVYHGKNGADGAPGATGPQGPRGPQGPQGPPGTTGGISVSTASYPVAFRVYNGRIVMRRNVFTFTKGVLTGWTADKSSGAALIDSSGYWYNTSITVGSCNG